MIRKAGNSGVREVAPASPVVALRRQGSRLPLFLVPGTGGQVITFGGMTRYLGEDQPVFGFQPKGIDGREPFFMRVEDMASYYLGGLREVQPHGPYCLAGHSFGGLVAFEMAQQLHAAGETVSLLALLDTIEWQYLERYRASTNLRQRFEMYKLRFQGVFLAGDGPRQAANRALGVLSRRLDHLMYKRRLLSAPRDPALIHRIAMSEYRPTLYPGRLTIFRGVRRGVFDGNDELLGWGGLAAGGIDVQDVTGSHQDMLSEPNVRMLADKLQACLDRAQEANEADPNPAALLQARSLRQLSGDG